MPSKRMPAERGWARERSCRDPGLRADPANTAKVLKGGLAGVATRSLNDGLRVVAHSLGQPAGSKFNPMGIVFTP
jgi:hypothetical protein